MLVIMLMVMLASTLVYLLVQQRKSSRYWADRGVPHSPPHPLLGSFDCMFKKNVGIWMRDLHAKFSAPFVGIWVFRQPVLLVADPEVSKRILISDSDLFRNRYSSSGKTDPIGALNIFTVNEPMWSNIRRRLTYIFTASKLKAMQPLVSSKAKAVIDRLKQDKINNKTTDIRNLFTDYTTDVFGTFAFGIENNSIVTGDSPIRAVTREFMKYDWFRGLSWYSVLFCPALVDIFRFSLYPKKTVEFFKKTVISIIDQRMVSQIENNDLLDALIKIKKEKLDDGQEFSDDMLTAQAVIMLQGGFEGTAVAITFAVYELAYHPEIQEKLFKELSEAKSSKGGADIYLSDLDKLTYLNCVSKESLRKYPPMGWLDRISSVDYKISDNLTLPAGTPVYVNAIGMHYDPQYFPDPYDFNPDRFLPENEKNIVPYSYLPFGDGPRMCIGKRFGQMVFRFMLAELVLNMQFRALPGHPKPREVAFENKGMFLSPGELLTVEVIPRDGTEYQL